MTVLHTVVSILQSFNFVIASQENNEVESDHINHVISFLRLEIRYKLSYDILTSFIASSILLDAYSSKMHSKIFSMQSTDHELNKWLEFNSKTLYEVIYHRSCFKSLMSSFMKRFFAEHLIKKKTKKQKQCIEKHLIMFFSNMISFNKIMTQMHQKKTDSIDIFWFQLKSNNTCLCCLSRKSKIHFSTNILSVMSAFEFMKMRCLSWNVNIILILVFYVISKIASSDSNHSLSMIEL